MSQRKGSRNMLHLMFDPDGMRPFVERWDEIATSLIHRLRTEATGRVIDLKTRELLAALLAYSDVKIGSRAGGHRASQNRPEPRDEDHISFTFVDRRLRVARRLGHLLRDEVRGRSHLRSAFGRTGAAGHPFYGRRYNPERISAAISNERRRAR
jgi:MmyB-like transcription regulator ligand binding domain